jgi:sec-independent protein translocase protein TatA
MGLGVTELLIILAIALVVFGANKLPGIGDAIGRSIKNFKRASKDEPEDEKDKALPAGSAARTDRQLGKAATKASTDEDGEWEEVVVRRKKKSADS